MHNDYHLRITVYILFLLLTYNHILMSRSSDSVIFFSSNVGDDSKAISSAVSYAMKAYRSSITQYMNQCTQIIQNMQQVDQRCQHDGDIVHRIHRKYLQFMAEYPHYVERNEEFVSSLVLKYPLELYMTKIENYADDVLNDTFSDHQHSKGSKSQSYSTIEQLLAHINRDWGSGGIQVRQQIYYELIIQVLASTYSDPSNIRILIPGCGLGRLATEIVARGFM
jgi:hypothetical protein